MSVFYKIAGIAAAVMILLSLYIAGSMLTGIGSLSFIEPSKTARLSAMSYQLNREAPRDINETTRFERVVAVPGGLQYHFTFRSLTRSEIDVAALKSIVYAENTAATCEDPALLNLLVSEDIYVEAVYYGSDGEMVTSVRVDGKSCEAVNQ